MFKNLFLIFFLFCVISYSKAFKILDVTYEIRSEQLLDLDVTYALFEISLDQDIELIDAFGCTPVCKELPKDCTPCDYTLKENCGVSEPYNTSYGNTTDCYCPKKKEWCENDIPANNYVVLENGREIGPFELDDNNLEKYFRFYFDLPCNGFRIRIIDIYGNTEVQLGYDDPTIGGGSGYYYSTFPEFTACPIEFFFRYGTYGLFVVGHQGQNSLFKIILEYYDFSSQKYIEPEPPTKCEKDKFGAYCFKDGIPTGPIQLPKYGLVVFRLDVTECKQYLLYRELVSSSENSMGNMGILFGEDFPSVSPTLYHINHPLSYVFNVCPNPEKNLTQLYISASNVEVDMGIIFTLTSDKSSWRTRKLSSFSIVHAERYLRGAFDIQLGSKLFDCYRGADFWGTSCLETWTVIPTNETTGLWPRPRYFLQRDPTTFSDLPYISDEVVVDRILSGALLLEITVGTERTETYPNWRTTLQSSNCTINFRSWAHWTTSDNMIITGKIKPKLKGHECFRDDFLYISKNIDNLGNQIAELSQSSLVLATRYQIDLQTFTPTWQSCNKFVQEFLKVKTERIEIKNTTICNAELAEKYLNDACCHQSVSWEYCCVPRTISINEDTFQVPSSIKSSDSCHNTLCLDSLLNDYVFYEELRDSDGGCSTAITEPLGVKQDQALNFYRECKIDSFGKDGIGKHCYKDGQCLFKCDILNNRCVYQNQSELEVVYRQFINCLSDNMPPSVYDHFIHTYSLDPEISQNNFNKFLLKTFSFENCVTWIGRSTQSDKRQIIPLSPDNCASCPNEICFDESCKPPLRCEEAKQYGRPGSVCGFGKFYALYSRSDCESYYSCSWNSSLTTKEECIGELDEMGEALIEEYVCLICETPTSCIEVPGITKANKCDEKYFCVINGDVVLGLTQSECEQKGFCSIDCIGCNDSIDTCQNNGVCSDTSYIDYLHMARNLPNNQYPGYVVSDDGYCIEDINAYNDPDCAQDFFTNSSPIPTDLGCLVIKNKSNCNDKDKHSVWHTLLDNKEECEKQTTCIEKNILTSMTTHKDVNQCLECGGTPKSVFTWTQGEWITATYRKAEWKKKEWIPNSRYDHVIDLNALSSEIMNSVINVFSLELQTEAHCRLNPVKDVVSRILCVCSGTESNEECLNSDASLDIGVGEPCADQKYSFTAPPSVVSFDESSVIEGCQKIRVSTLLSSEIKTDPTPSISLSFRYKSGEVHNVKNSKGGIVGKILGNGVFLEFNQSNINNFTLCLSFDSSIDIQHFSVFDFGSRTSLVSVSPVGFSIQKRSTQLCALIDPSFTQEPSYYPIARIENWENHTNSNSLSDTELIVYTIMFCLYLIVFVCKVYEEVRGGFSYFPPKRGIGVLLMFAIAVRLAYICVLLSNVLDDSQDSLSEFLLIEIPSYFYFLSLTLAALIWYSVVNQQRSETLRKVVAQRFSFITSIYLLFIISIILAWVLSEEEGTYVCEGRVYQSPDDSTQETVRLTYRIVISLFSLSICLAVFYYGRKMSQVLSATQLMSRGKNALKAKTFVVAIVSGISLFGQCIFFIAYSTADPAPEYLFFFVPLELLPASIIFVLMYTPPKHKSGSGSGLANSTIGSTMRSNLTSDGV